MSVVVERAKPPNPQSSDDDRATRVGRLQRLSGGARRLDNEWKPPDGDLTWALARALLHDALASRVTAAAMGSRARGVSDLFDGARPPERAGANRSIRHGVAVANDHGWLPRRSLAELKKTFNIIFSAC